MNAMLPGANGNDTVVGAGAGLPRERGGDDSPLRQAAFGERRPLDGVVGQLSTDVDLPSTALGTAGETDGMALGLDLVVCQAAVRPVRPVGAPRVQVVETLAVLSPRLEWQPPHLHPDKPSPRGESKLNRPARPGPQVRVGDGRLLVPLPADPALERLPDVEVVGARLTVRRPAAVDRRSVRKVALLSPVLLRGQLLAAATEKDAAVEVLTRAAPHERVEVVMVVRQEHRPVGTGPPHDGSLNLAGVFLIERHGRAPGMRGCGVVLRWARSG